jgi:POT family proton-dependent oligopeptide transporter
MKENQVNQGHPKGLYVLFVTEMWERFSYYGMRALLVLFMAKALMFDKAYGSQIYGSYTGLVYLTPLVGGYMADRYWGNRKSIIIGGILMAIGQFFMFLSGMYFQNISLASMLMFTGLGFLIFGNGFFKPNISTMVGQLYPQGDKRVDSAFTIFYMGINLGAFIAPLLCGFVGETENPADFKWGFLMACGGMILSVILFVLLKDKYIVTPEGVQIGTAPNTARKEKVEVQSAPVSNKLAKIWGIIWILLLILFYVLLEFERIQKIEWNKFSEVILALNWNEIWSFISNLLGGDIIGAFIFSLTLAAPGYIISDPTLTKAEKQRIWVIYIVAFFVIFFWSAFEQAGASLTYFAEEQTNRNLLGTVIPSSAFQSVNAVAIVIFAPLFSILWVVLGKKNIEPASPYKQAIGLFLLALGYLVIAFGVLGLEPGVKVSMIWLLSLYTIHTFGELCLSPIGLSMVNKLAPVKFASLLMGVWFLSTASANKFAGTLSQFYPEATVSIEQVQKLQTEKKVTLLPEDFKADVAEEINGTKVISFEKVKISDIKDVAVKEEIKGTLEKSQIIKSKKFLGFEINSLYSFFMLFVFMAGAASIVLFVLSSWLKKMMNEDHQDSHLEGVSAKNIEH